MEASGLFNPGFLGSGFHWWVGQIVDDSTWRENLNEEKFDDPDAIPGWGYRYKVRIMGCHDQEEESVTAEQLPWCHVMYPITAGGGQGGSYQTPGLKMGNFVFGFFLDGQDMQQPVIMGVLGNNAKTKLERRVGSKEGGGKNYTPQSFYSKQEKEEPETQKKVKDDTFTPAGDYGSPKKGNITLEAADAENMYTNADEQKKNVLEEEHSLACPDPDRKSDMKNIQTVQKELTKKTEQYQKSLSNAKKAGALPILQMEKDISVEIERTSKQTAKFMKGIMGQIQQKTTDEFNNKLQPMVNLAVPAFTNQIMGDKVKGLEKIACAFNGINAGLAGMIGAALMNAFKKKKKASRATPPVGIGTALGSTRANNGVLETFIPVVNASGDSHGNWVPTEEMPPELDTPGSDILPPPPRDGYYTPTPLCTSEELVGEVLGSSINTIMQAYDDAMAPVVNSIKVSLGASADLSGDAGSEPVGTVNNAINENNVLSALSSGDLVGSMSSTMAEQAGVKANIIGPVTNAFINGDYASGINALLGLAGADIPANQTAIAAGMLAFASGDVAQGFNAVSGVLGFDAPLANGIGSAFAAIKSGDTASLLNAAGGLASMYPGILNSIAGKGAALSGMDLGGMMGLGSLGGMNFDIAASMSFVQTIAETFDCDPPPECSPNDVHTMQSGGTSADAPSDSNVAQKAAKTADTASSQVKDTPKKFSKPTLKELRARTAAREAAGPQVGDKVDLDDGDLNDALEMF